MRLYLYDGSFDGLLTAYFYAYKDPAVYDIVRQNCYQPDLLSQPRSVATEADKAARIDRAVYQQLSANTMRNLYLLYLSELPHCELLGLRYLRLCFTKGAAVNRAKQHPIIGQVEDCRRKVMTEYDHMKGFLRFEQIGQQTYFGRFAPDHNQLPLLLPHLQKRFSDQKLIVYDEKRSCALIYDLEQSAIIPFCQQDAARLLQGRRDETIELFQQYFQSIAIKERTNPRLQAQYMPHRYRKYMPETQDASNL